MAAQVLGFGKQDPAAIYNLSDAQLEQVKAKLLELQYSPEEIEVMRQVKRRLDPQWLLGQGTLFGEGAL